MDVWQTAAPIILGLFFACQPLNADARNDALAATRIARIEAFVKDAAATAPGICVLVVDHDQVIYRQAFGLADIEHHVQLEPQYPFRIGSLTKQFTAVAILQLVDRGMLSLDDGAAKYLPDLPASFGGVTLRHLLTHTSGIRSYTDIAGWQELARQDRSPGQLLSLVRNSRLEFLPGHDLDYSNTNYVILGAVIEKVTGVSYAAYLKAHVLDPAGMTCTAYDDVGSIVLHRVRGYTGAAKSWRNADFISISNAYAAGGLISNIDDLWKWEQSLSSGTVIRRELLEQARSENRLADGRGTGYGFGWAVGTLDGHATAEHGGRIPGFQSYTIRVSDAGVFVAVLFNTDDEASKPDRLALRVTRTLIDDQTPSLPTTPADVRQYLGTYRSASGAEMRFILDKEVLTLDDQGHHWPLTRVGEREFVSWRDVRHFRFQVDQKNHPKKLLAQARLGVEQLFTRKQETGKD